MTISTRNVRATLTTLAMAATTLTIGTNATRCGIACFIQLRASAGIASRLRREVMLSMRNRPFTLAYGFVLMLGMAGAALAQDNGVQHPSARQQLQRIHTPQSIDQELARLSKDLELSREQQQQVRPLLREHHDRIQTLFDKNPTAS